MFRRFFDAIPIFTGIAIAAVLLVAGVLLTWAHSSLLSDAQQELVSQKIVFPAANSRDFSALPAPDAAALTKYAGLLLTTGPQAQAYADDFIAVENDSVSHGQTYSQVNDRLATAGHDRALFIQAADLFRNETIQGQLRYDNGFWKIGQLLLSAAILAFAVAGVLLVLSAIGLGRRVAIQAEALLKPALQGT